MDTGCQFSYFPKAAALEAALAAGGSKEEANDEKRNMTTRLADDVRGSGHIAPSSDGTKPFIVHATYHATVHCTNATLNARISDPTQCLTPPPEAPAA